MMGNLSIKYYDWHCVNYHNEKGTTLYNSQNENGVILKMTMVLYVVDSQNDNETLFYYQNEKVEDGNDSQNDNGILYYYQNEKMGVDADSQNDKFSK